VWGPAPIESYNGFKYYVTFIDDHSRTTWVYLLKSKHEVFFRFQEFFNLVGNQFGAKIKFFRSDNGTEYVNKNFSDFFKEKRIIHQTTCVNTPQQNGVSERKNRHLLEVTRSLLFQNNVPKSYWSDAVLTAIYLINRLPSAKLNFKSPLEILMGREINLGNLRVFGCTCFIYTHRPSKLDAGSIKAIFLGYSSEKKGYKCYDTKNHKLYIVFVENEPFYSNSSFTNDSNAKEDQANIPLPSPFFFPQEINKRQVEETREEESIEEVENPLRGGDVPEEETLEEEASVRRSTRQTRRPERLRDFVSHQVKYPIQSFLSYEELQINIELL
jgi:Integrase core domain